MTPRQQSILIGAIVTGILSTSYLAFINVICCLGVIAGGAVATQQYTSRTGAAVESGDGAVLGALAGAGGAILSAFLDRALRPLGLDAQSIQQSVMQNLSQDMQGQQMPPMMEQFQGDGSGGGAMILLLGVVFNAVVFAIFGAVGGAIGAAIFGDEAQGGDVGPGGPSPRDLGPENDSGGDRGKETAPREVGSGLQDESSAGAESNREGSV